MKKHGLLIITLISTLIFMPVMVLMFMYNDVLAGDFKRSDQAIPSEDQAEERSVSVNSNIEITGEVPEKGQISLCIPLDNNVTAGMIDITEDRNNDRVYVSLPTDEEEFYIKNQLSGSQKGILDIAYDHNDDRANFVITTDGYNIIKASMDEDNLYFLINKPRELYGHVFVIDPKYGGEETGSVAYGVNEKDITLSVANAVKNAGEMNSDGGVVLTRNGDETKDKEERYAFIQKTEPDLLVKIGTSADKNTRTTNGISAVACSKETAELAEKMLASAAEATGQKNLGVKIKEFEESDHTDAGIIELKLGYMTNKGEMLKIAGDDYAQTVGAIVYAYIIGAAGQ